MSLPNDVFGKSVAVQTTGGRDVYTTADGRVASFPAGAPLAQAYSSLNGMAPSDYVPPVVLLSQSLSPQQFGQYMILTAQQSSISRGLQPTQRLSMVSTLAPYVALLNSGDLAGFVAVSGSIPVDGTIITPAVVAQFVGLITQYLAGNV